MDLDEEYASTVAKPRVINRLRKRRFVGSGLQSAMRQAIDPESGMSPAAKEVLAELLRDKGIDVSTENYDARIDDQYGSNLTVSKKDAIPPGTDDSAAAALGRDGKLSLFRSLLSVIDRATQLPVSTKHLIKTCCLSLRPGDVPGALDAKEVVLSVLFFLSSTLKTKSSHLVCLPLIKPTEELNDLEKRTYEKVGDWRIESIDYKLLHLEQAFLHSPASFRWLSREKFSPRLTAKEEARFFLKGTIPAAIANKRLKGERGVTLKQRKSQTAPAAKAKKRSSASSSTPRKKPKVAPSSAVSAFAMTASDGSPSPTKERYRSASLDRDDEVSADEMMLGQSHSTDDDDDYD